jgi:hypothetical protein
MGGAEEVLHTSYDESRSPTTVGDGLTAGLQLR